MKFKLIYSTTSTPQLQMVAIMVSQNWIEAKYTTTSIFIPILPQLKDFSSIKKQSQQSGIDLSIIMQLITRI